MPRGDVLERIARGAETTIDWLLTGRGPEPRALVSEPMFWTPARRRWSELVSRLELDSPTHAAMLALPGATQRAWTIACSPEAWEEVEKNELRVLAELETLELRTWIKWLEGVLRTRPATVVRLALERNRNAILLGMSGAGIHLDEVMLSTGHPSTMSLREAIEATSNYVVAAYPTSRAGERRKTRPHKRKRSSR
jgi:hypothetical protein